MPKKMYTQELEGTRRRGRPRKEWKEEVERDLQVLGVRRWRELVADRKKWKDIVRQAKAHTVGCSANGRRRRNYHPQQWLAKKYFSVGWKTPRDLITNVVVTIYINYSRELQCRQKDRMRRPFFCRLPCIHIRALQIIAIPTEVVNAHTLFSSNSFCYYM